jgi:hypothetical protein
MWLLPFAAVTQHLQGDKSEVEAEVARRHSNTKHADKARLFLHKKAIQGNICCWTRKHWAAPIAWLCYATPAECIAIEVYSLKSLWARPYQHRSRPKHVSHSMHGVALSAGSEHTNKTPALSEPSHNLLHQTKGCCTTRC